jgi:membrane-associated protease RseP (regulator of RpoE activity)
MLDTLKSLQPLHLIVSINSLSKEQRAGLMHEREARTDVAFSSLKEMVKRRIPFGLSVVAHPAIPVTALIADLLALDHSGAAFVRVNLPSFTRFHPGRPHDQTPDHWTQVVKAICELRYEMATPIITIPSAFENELISEDADAPRVLGTIAQSPARRAGVRVGDLIVRINSFSIATRSELIAMLSLTQPPIHLTVVRLDGRTHEVTLAPEPSDGYPYVGHVINKYVFPWGMVVSPSLSNADASVIRALANELDEPLWIVTSPLMLETARRFVSRHIREARRPIDFVAVENTFLGGEIQVLDMATVVDIVDSVSRAIAVKGRRPGALFVPSTGFNELGRDLVGIHRDEIGSRLGVQVAFSSHTARFAF